MKKIKHKTTFSLWLWELLNKTIPAKKEDSFIEVNLKVSWMFQLAFVDFISKKPITDFGGFHRKIKKTLKEWEKEGLFVETSVLVGLYNKAETLIFKIKEEK